MIAAKWVNTPVALLLCACLAAAAEEPPPNPTPSKASAETEPAAEESGEFKAPPGFKTKKRGALTLYCRREDVLGSRFKAEKCYDEAGVKELERAKREAEDLMNKIRNCGVGTCGIT